MKYKFDLVNFAKDLHMEKWSRGGTTRSFGEWFGVSASTISRWENAKGEPPIADFLVMCSCLSLNPLNYLMQEVEQQPVLPGMEDYAEPEFQEIPLFDFEQEYSSDLGYSNDDLSVDFDELTGNYR